MPRRRAGDDPLRAISSASMVFIVSVPVGILTGTAGPRLVVALISEPIRYGSMNRSALTVLTSQLRVSSRSGDRACRQRGSRGGGSV